MRPPSFSIVINTLNRGPSLKKTLESFRWLKYDGDFEIVVVNGPSTDGSDDVIRSFLPSIRAGKCDAANLSMSRNIGICMARGDIVAFIDDDAIPEPEWLAHLAAGYDDVSIGGVGGIVYDHTGYAHQYEFSTANRLANANWAAGRSTEHFCFPKSFEFPYLQGTNSSFRRAALLEVGGFDEEIEFYLDETELCCRLIDAGYVIRQLPGARVHHKFAPSHIRDEQKITRHRYPVIKNKIYFSLKHGRDYCSIADITDDNRKFTNAHASDVERHIGAGRLDPSERDRFWRENERAWERGLTRGLSGAQELITPDKQARWAGEFRKFAPLALARPKALIFVSRDFPPGHAGGIATFNKDLAEALAAEGHIVHVITRSPDINRVDFEHGVWVHRMVEQESPRPADAVERNIPQHIWNWSATALREAARIATHRSIDVVEAPIWDCEGIAFLLDGRWPLVTSLQTTLRFFLDYHPELVADPGWMENFGAPMLALERELIEKSAALRSISAAIREDVERAYACRISDCRVCVTHLGMPERKRQDPQAPVNPAREAADGVEILFVGRLEPRKGIDTLLAAIPLVAAEFPAARFRIVGDDTLHIPGSQTTYREQFVAAADEQLRERVEFEGRVDEDRLLAAYDGCDIFVAPSRFESFGLIFLEAMRAGKPVIGCRAGGVPEIVAHEENGLLIAPGDANALAGAIVSLARSAGLRAQMGERGRAIFQERFTAEAMAQRSAPLLDLAARNFIEAAE